MDVTLEMAIDRVTSPERGGEALTSFEWGLHPESIKTYHPWSDADFERFQTETGCTVPTQLEALLRSYAMVHVESDDYDKPQYDSFLAKWDDGFQSQHSVKTLIDRLESMISNYRIFRHDQALPDRFPHEMVFFGDADGGLSQLLMSGTDPEDNTVYLWKKANNAWGEGDNAGGLARCADTLFEFMYNLVPEEDL